MRPVDLELTRRQLLKVAAAAALAWEAAPWPIRVPRAFAQTPPDDPTTVMTLEAFSDTLIPGEKRPLAERHVYDPNDRAIGDKSPPVTGAGAVQAGALDMMNYPPVGAAAALPGVAAALNARATTYAGQHAIVLDPTVPPFVSLAFPDRTALLVELLDSTATNADEQLVYFAFAAVVFLAYHTAGFEKTADALRTGHPGLAAIHFPTADADELYRYPDHSYRKTLAAPSPRTSRRGSPS